MWREHLAGSQVVPGCACGRIKVIQGTCGGCVAACRDLSGTGMRMKGQTAPSEPITAA